MGLQLVSAQLWVQLVDKPGVRRESTFLCTRFLSEKLLFGEVLQKYISISGSNWRWDAAPTASCPPGLIISYLVCPVVGFSHLKIISKPDFFLP